MGTQWVVLGVASLVSTSDGYTHPQHGTPEAPESQAGAVHSCPGPPSLGSNSPGALPPAQAAQPSRSCAHAACAWACLPSLTLTAHDTPGAQSSGAERPGPALLPQEHPPAACVPRSPTEEHSKPPRRRAQPLPQLPQEHTGPGNPEPVGHRAHLVGPRGHAARGRE